MNGTVRAGSTERDARRRRRWAVAALAVLAVVMSSIQVLTAPPARAADLTADTIRKDLTFADARLAATAGRLATNAYPVRTGTNGVWTTVGATDWTSGFFPGAMWQEYARTQDPVWKQRAEAWQAGVEVNKTDDTSHDVGFQIFDSFGKDAAITGDANAKAVTLTAAQTLATRYNAKVGAIRSWDARTDTTQYRVIMDNMMNLELLFWASQNGGDASWATIAATHAKTTARDFFRSDGGSWHVVNYDQSTGAVKAKTTAQGYSNDSTWSRGEAWAVHGFTMSYRFTHDTTFLTTARTAADYFLAHLPADKVPYWDFSLPSTTGQPRDSSAAAIAASGLVELSTLETDANNKARYLAGARDILAGLSSTAYLADGTTNQAVLLHGTQNKPSGSYDTGIMFGDYYFIEALQRYAAATGVDTAPTTTPTTTTTASPPTTTACSGRCGTSGGHWARRRAPSATRPATSPRPRTAPAATPPSPATGRSTGPRRRGRTRSSGPSARSGPSWARSAPRWATRRPTSTRSPAGRATTSSGARSSGTRRGTRRR